MVRVPLGSDGCVNWLLMFLLPPAVAGEKTRLRYDQEEERAFWGLLISREEGERGDGDFGFLIFLLLLLLMKMKQPRWRRRRRRERNLLKNIGELE